MKVILWHSKECELEIGKLADRPADVKPEEVKERIQKCTQCIVAFITVEKGDDSEETTSGLAREIVKMSTDVGHETVMLFPFAHLSSNLADSEESLKTLKLLEKKLKDKGLAVTRGHFGSHKEFFLHVYGHPGNVRWREF